MSMQPEPAPEIVMDRFGSYWRNYDGHLSMCPVSDDNDPLVEPVVVYRPAVDAQAVADALHSWGGSIKPSERLPLAEHIAAALSAPSSRNEVEKP